MGASGAAFTTAIAPDTWDPLAAAPLDGTTLRRAAAAAGTRPDVVAPPFDAELRELVLARIDEALAAELPPLARGLVGPPEYGLIVGRTEDEERIHARTFFDHGDDPTAVGWDAFVDEEHGGLVFLDRAEPPERVAVVRAGVDAAVGAGAESDAALEAWAAGLRDDGRWSDARHAGAAAFADHAMRGLYVDKRRAAASFLRSVRGDLSNPAGAEVLRAAEAYGYAAEAVAKLGTGAFEAGVAMRFLDPGHRRAEAKALEAALGHDRTGREALAAARQRM